LPSPQHPVVGSLSDEQHARIADIDTAIIALVRRRMAVMAELENLRRNGRVPRIELTRENGVFRRYEAELGRLGTRPATLLTGRR
jgi:chorismate mutase